ncbi:hypothetical protein J1N35_039825 [Gossypium stocksii]|uniref:RNase H type-1 domain-containing protein n=1 Tax=Gossypium stocksii TaxID=47602 RepID=A0A9D3ZHQ1_9ROSI|nr:hypothetical protein J1N35_039825 [Gossypium stocksii]
MVLVMDSVAAIQLIQTFSIEHNHSTVLQAIKGLLQLSWTVQITHVFREGNKVVDGLASIVSSRPLGRYIFMQPPDEVLRLLHNDKSGMA